MSSEVAIKVSNIGKRFRVYDSPRARLMQAFRRKPCYKEFVALDGVSLVINKGETVGIVGRNGSGKSTLLQIICGTLTPSSGEVLTHGRIAALLELGAGFNPDFSGRENVFMNAAVLGLSDVEIAERFASIEAFAEIGDFIDQPVKNYSSGMKVRLAFAVAINVDPQILIVDEALAVGDELFQRKCYARIENIKAQGATILFVSHASNTVLSLCDRAILLDAGRKLSEGSPKAVVGLYQRLLNAPPDKAGEIRQRLLDGQGEVVPSGDLPRASSELVAAPGEDYLDPHLVSKTALSYESRGAYISSPMIINAHGQQVNCLKAGERYRYQYLVKFERSANNVRFGMLVKTTTGVELGGATSAKQVFDGISHVEAGSVLLMEYSFVCRLNEGVYFLNAGVSGDCGEGFHHLHRLVDALCFRVNPQPDRFGLGVVDFSCSPEWSLMG
ncbi:ABC transporter ATP-binding protein [Pseudomonas sp. NY15463]|jgi:lipopolysaccharide transport system ATP-binding protein|uniref:ABC transporter ATP-binding protein n=1 Tax=Pseudomonas sp. NY15463 TaxID=3400361 RepID=UPI003A882367